MMKQNLLHYNKKMLELDLNDPDAVVQYLIDFYEKNEVNTEKKLVAQLSKHKPLKTIIDLQKRSR